MSVAMDGSRCSHRSELDRAVPDLERGLDGLCCSPSRVAVHQFGIWARQLSLWTVLMISPTPGSSGLAELALPTFMERSDAHGPDLQALWAAVILMWRYLTYHLYVLGGRGADAVLAGTNVRPRWPVVA